MDILSLFRCQQYNILNNTWNIIKTSTRSAVDVAYDIHGAKPTESKKHIIVLHGLLGSKKNWKSACNKIASTLNVCVISADARNHGDSPHDSAHSYIDLAGDASKLQQNLSLTQSHIIGHSMGGRTGMVLALSEPTRVQSLIVVDISPIPRTPNPVDSSLPKLIEAMKSVNFQGAENGPKARSIAMKTLTDAGFDERTLGFILMSIGQRPDKSFGWKYNLDPLLAYFEAIATFPQEMQGKQYLGPTLFVGGGKSDYLRKNEEPAIKKFFPQGILTYIEHVGHNVHAEDPSAFLKIVFEFYSKHL